MKTIKSYLTTGEAARLVGVSITRIRQMEVEGKLLPVARAGQNWLYDKRQVSELARVRETAEGRSRTQ